MQGGPTMTAGAFEWTTRHSPFNRENARAAAEEELLALAPETPTTVLDLCGLWGGTRQPRNWLARVAPSKDALRKKVRASSAHSSSTFALRPPPEELAKPIV